MPKVSVIVPFYNVEKYIEKCLETLVNQTLDDIEIILVNDGSKDKTVDIVEKYKSRSSDYVCNKFNWDEVTKKTLDLYYGEER